jgi:hypothetical protein
MRKDEPEGMHAELAALHAAKRRGLRRGLVAAALALVALPVWRAHGERVRSFVRGEVTLEGEPRYAPEHPPDPRALAAIDFARVHAELLPRWTIARAHATSPYWERRAEARFDALAAEVAPDPNLHDLLTRTRAALADDPLAHARRLDYWLWAYNAYLDAQGVPWRVEASLGLGGERPVFRTLSYEVMADAENAAGQRLRLLRRADRTNTLEGWMGQTGRPDDGAMVLMRRVLHFTVRHVWPGLHPALDGRRPPAERAWLPHVRQEVREALDPETFRRLQETAVDQQLLIEVTAAIEGRAACGSRFRIHGLPYNGLSARSLAALERALARSRGVEDCPDVTLSEAASLVGASERLGTTEDLAPALETLAMVVARSVAAHELRHVADGPDGDAIACPGCPEGLDGLARAEVSAYLAAFATEDLGYLALLQACATPPGPGVHGAARTAVLEALLPFGCEGPTLHGLYPLAAAIERALFGDRPAVELPALPERVQLLPRPARARR